MVEGGPASGFLSSVLRIAWPHTPLNRQDSCKKPLAVGLGSKMVVAGRKKQESTREHEGRLWRTLSDLQPREDKRASLMITAVN